MRIKRKQNKAIKRIYRHQRVRGKVKGTAERPRLSVFRSNKYIYAQIINDELGQTLVASNSREIKQDKKAQKFIPIKKAYQVGELIAEKALKKGLLKIVFDKGGYAYHGRVKALADGARKKGLKF